MHQPEELTDCLVGMQRTSCTVMVKSSPVDQDEVRDDVAILAQRCLKLGVERHDVAMMRINTLGSQRVAT